MATNKNWIITVSGKRPIAAVKKDIVAQGFAVDQVLEAIGCITGTAAETTVKKIRGIAGVADVSPESGPIDIGNPDAPITW